MSDTCALCDKLPRQVFCDDHINEFIRSPEGKRAAEVGHCWDYSYKNEALVLTAMADFVRRVKGER